MSLAVAKNIEVRFERGFKTWCENIALQLRTTLGVAKHAPLAPSSLAGHLNIRILPVNEVQGVSPDTITYLTNSARDEWSAMTITCGSTTVIIVNSAHSLARQASDIMHELAHIIRGHKQAQVFIDSSGITIRTFNDLQEAEADWLAGSLLLPRPALLAAYAGMQKDQACRYYGVSESLYNYRLNVSGIIRQFNRRH